MLRAEVRGHNSQLSLLKQVSSDLQRIFLRAKRKPAPSTQARPCPEALCIGGMREGKGRVWRERWDWRKPDDARGPLGAAASRDC
ncbi:hypothetical protein DXA87_17055 [Desulfotomaculum sp. OF05-3]|nr:hypothetical protein DXA87_17055 [Desulfotomaculum sp. OF05-3]